MTTTTKDYAAVAARETIDGLHLAIYANHDIVNGDIGLFSDQEVTDAHAIHTAATNELHTRAHAEYTTGGTESPQARRDRTRQTAPACTDDTLTEEACDRTDGYTRRVALDELHGRALKINPRGIVTEIAAGPDGIRTRLVEPHLATRKAAVRHLADLIRQHGMDGDDISDMGHDEFNGMTLADRAAYPAVYTFLLSACAKFRIDGYDLVRAVITSELGW